MYYTQLFQLFLKLFSSLVRFNLNQRVSIPLDPFKESIPLEPLKVYMKGGEELGNSNSKKGLAYFQTGNDSDTHSDTDSSRPIKRIKTNHDRSNEEVQDNNQKEVSSEIGKKVMNYDNLVFNENFNEMVMQKNWYSGYKIINGQLYHNILPDRLALVPYHHRIQHPEIMKLIDRYNEEYNKLRHSNMPSPALSQNRIYNLELYLKFVTEDLEVLKCYLIERPGFGDHGLGILLTKD
jgi:hypothetical protein